jgi:uncharacterized protein YprB with RNaseH-like and TPR domain
LSALADRIRGIVSGGLATGAGADPRVATGVGADLRVGPEPCATDGIGEILGGEWRHSDGRACFVVERRWEPSALHGRERIGELAERLDRASGEASLFTNGAPARPPFVFFDLETTGLSGGAGTLAFLVGCAEFDADGALRTRQFVLTRYADERALLEAVSGELARAGTLVSFNGKSFDAPLLETRYLFHRLGWVGSRVPHVDVLHPARQFWKGRAEQAPPLRCAVAAGPEPVRRAGGAEPLRRAVGAELARPEESNCSLGALERQIVGARRVGDVPGFEIPGRYFQFVRGGDARPLAAVLEHNRLDLLTLAALTARLLHLARIGPDGACDAREALALGRVYVRGGFDARACAAFRRAVEMSEGGRSGASEAPVRIDSLRSLAIALRRSRHYADAAACWRRLLEARGCPPHIAREATEALAIHHEHRERDLAAAKTFALRSLENGPRPSPAWTEAVRHRVARLESKMSGEGLKSEQRRTSDFRLTGL